MSIGARAPPQAVKPLSLLKRAIAWAVRRAGSRRVNVVTFDRIFLFRRYEPFWRDEYVGRDGRHWNRPPWWRPFNVLLHCWRPEAGSTEGFHDHPRWSVTICLRGKIVELTPWGERILTAGSVVLRSRKAIHAFRVPDEHRGRTWTLFIAGPRNHRQNTYAITPR